MVRKKVAKEIRCVERLQSAVEDAEDSGFITELSSTFYLQNGAQSKQLNQSQFLKSQYSIAHNLQIPLSAQFICVCFTYFLYVYQASN